MHSSKILLVDDQRRHLNTLKKMFEHFGCDVVTVDSGEEAEFILDWASDFDAIVTDLKMPWLDGVEFCADTKKKFPQLQIYALSGNLKSYGSELLNYAGFDGIYQKPISLELVDEMLQSIGSHGRNPSTNPTETIE